MCDMCVHVCGVCVFVVVYVWCDLLGTGGCVCGVFVGVLRVCVWGMCVLCVFVCMW